MSDESRACSPHSHLSSAQRLLHAFSASPSSTVLLTTALGEMLGVLARQQRAIDNLTSALREARKERAREIAAVSNSFSEILHDTIRRTAAAVAELRGSGEAPTARDAEKQTFVKSEAAEIPKFRRFGDSADFEMQRLRDDVAAARRDHDALLELFDVRKTLQRNGYEGDLAADVRRIGTTFSKVKLLHQLPCLHVLVAAVAHSPERRPQTND